MKSKVAIVRCKTYNQPEVYEAIRFSLDLIGGVRDFLKPGQRVLLKPNLLSAAAPETGIDTHPEIVRALVRLLKGIAGEVLIGDSPGGYRERLEDVYERSGMKGIAREEGISLVKFDRAEDINNIPIASIARECDALISIPKLKTHALLSLTLAIKNTFGVVPGLFKSECHKMAPHPRDFARLLVDIFASCRPNLSILDAVVAMEGDGPAAGDLRHLGLIMASRDAVALDAVASAVLGLEPLDILTTREAAGRGLGSADLAGIEVVGESIEAVKVKDFKLPRTPIFLKIPKPVLALGKQFIKFRPAADPNKCTLCAICRKSCPAQAIKMGVKKAEIDYAKCILCLCCHELCPNKAIHIDKSLLTRLLGF